MVNRFPGIGLFSMYLSKPNISTTLLQDIFYLKAFDA